MLHRRLLSTAALFHINFAFHYAECMYIRLLWCLSCYWAVWGCNILPVASFEVTRFCGQQDQRHRTWRQPRVI